MLQLIFRNTFATVPGLDRGLALIGREANLHRLAGRAVPQRVLHEILQRHPDQLRMTDDVEGPLGLADVSQVPSTLRETPGPDSSDSDRSPRHGR